MLNFNNDYFEVIEYNGKDPKYNAHTWKCKCKCGKVIVLRTDVVKSGATKSCGCTRNSIFVKGHPYGKRFESTHGLSKHPLFRVWSNIIDRCYGLKPKDKGYCYYKGKGITMCDEWKSNFKNFYDWAFSNNWKKGLSIDRKDSDGNYEPNNCQFITRSENSRRTFANNPRIGQLNGNSVLTWKKVKNIRERLMNNEKGSHIAKSYRVDKKTIYDIRDCKTWRLHASITTHIKV